MLTQWYGQGMVAESIAKAISDRGVDVGVVTGPEYRPDWSVGERKWRAERDRSGMVPVVRYPYYRSHTASGIRRFLSYASFAVATGARGTREMANSDVVLVYSSPATAAAAAMVTRRRHGIPYVLLVQDLWPDSVYATGFLTGPVGRRVCDGTVGRFVSASYREASAVIGISASMRRTLIDRGVPEDRAYWIYNWATDEDSAVPIAIPTRCEGGPLHVMYAGTMGTAQGLESVLRALAMVPDGLIRLSLLGSGTQESALRATSERLRLGDRVSFLGRVPRDQVAVEQSRAHLHLVALADHDLFAITVPSKLQALAARGAAVLCVAPGEAAELVERNGMGMSVTPGDPARLAGALIRAATLDSKDLVRMGANSRRMYQETMSRRVNADMLVDILRRSSRTAGPSGLRPWKSARSVALGRSRWVRANGLDNA